MADDGPDTETDLLLHASCVTLDGRALLITGASGSGKSGLAIQMMGLGASLLADDRTSLRVSGNQLWASCPASIRGLIEVRGMGLLKADVAGETAVSGVVDLDSRETERLPDLHKTEILGITLPLIRRTDTPVFAPALIQFLKKGRHRP
jgi:HPr kinase/phosphorylase